MIKKLFFLCGLLLGSLSLLQAGGNETSAQKDVLREFCKDTTKSKKSPATTKSASSQKGKKSSTNTITFVTTEYGVHCHVGWYPDGCISTSLDGTMTGLQLILGLNGAVLDSSTNFKKIRKNEYVHTYSWGKVYSYPNKQMVVPK
jgi:hypothetical protein